MGKPVGAGVSRSLENDFLQKNAGFPVDRDDEGVHVFMSPEKTDECPLEPPDILEDIGVQGLEEEHDIAYLTSPVKLVEDFMVGSE